MNVFATVLCVLVVAAAASAALVPELEPEFEVSNELEFYAQQEHFESTVAKLEAMGIDVKSLDRSVLEDAQLMVVSI